MPFGETPWTSKLADREPGLNFALQGTHYAFRYPLETLETSKLERFTLIWYLTRKMKFRQEEKE